MCIHFCVAPCQSSSTGHLLLTLRSDSPSHPHIQFLHAAAAVLKDAADTVEENGIQGSSTCCLVLVDTLQGRLTSANVGDSGFVIIGERCQV
jgi:serine/threonine protein phosphatase PrpC